MLVLVLVLVLGLMRVYVYCRASPRTRSSNTLSNVCTLNGHDGVVLTLSSYGSNTIVSAGRDKVCIIILVLSVNVV